VTRAGAIVLLAGALAPSAAHGLEPRRPGQENMISRAVFASERLWLLTDAGDLSTITPGEKVRVPVPLPEPALDICVFDGRVAALTCPRDACDTVTFRRWTAGKWGADAAIALEGDHVAALACSPDAFTILTNKRLLESTGGKVSARRLSRPTQGPTGLVTSLHVGKDQVFAGIDAGEWGGGLVRIDRKTGAVTRIEKNATGELCGGPLNTDCDPVNGIAAEPWKPGCVAAAVGLVHMMAHGRIVEVCGDEVRASYVKERASPPGQAKRRLAGTVAFFGLTRVGAALLASGTDGLYRFDGSAEPRYAPLPEVEAIGGVGVSFAVPNAVLVLTAINQRRSVSGNVPLLVSRLPESKPYGWFDATFPKLARLGPVAEAPAGWRAVATRQGLSMRLGADFVPRNDLCWEVHADKWPGAGWRDVCVDREPRELLTDDFRLRPAVEGDRAPTSDSPKATDLIVYDSWSASAGMLRGRRAMVERGRASGGMAGRRRVRTLHVVLELGPGEWVSFTGETGDDAGYDELLSIASTIEDTAP
jgi:hypothetical protein